MNAVPQLTAEADAPFPGLQPACGPSQTVQRLRERHAPDVSLPRHSTVKRDTVLQYSNRAKVTAAIGGRLFQMSFRSHMERDRKMGKRGCVQGFSAGARRRLMRKQGMVSVAGDPPLEVGLTFSDATVAEYVAQWPDGSWYYPPGRYESFCRRAKSDLMTWQKRLGRELPMVGGFWRMDAVKRKSGPFVGLPVPHFHLSLFEVPYEDEYMGHEADCLVWSNRHQQPVLRLPRDCYPVDGAVFLRLYQWTSPKAAQTHLDFQVLSHGSERQSASALHSQQDKMDFREWLSTSWYFVVDSHDMNHMRAGTHVTRLQSWAGFSFYFSHYMAHLSEVEVPLYGRTWGVFNRKCIPWAQMIDIEIDGAEGYRIRRIARRYIERQRGRRYFLRNGCGLSVFCNAEKWWTNLIPHSAPDPF